MWINIRSVSFISLYSKFSLLNLVYGNFRGAHINGWVQHYPKCLLRIVLHSPIDILHIKSVRRSRIILNIKILKSILCLFLPRQFFFLKIWKCLTSDWLNRMISSNQNLRLFPKLLIIGKSGARGKEWF